MWAAGSRSRPEECVDWSKNWLCQDSVTVMPNQCRENRTKARKPTATRSSSLYMIMCIELRT